MRIREARTKINTNKYHKPLKNKFLNPKLTLFKENSTQDNRNKTHHKNRKINS